MPRPTLLPTRGNLSDAASERLRRMIVEGQLADGARINEVHLAARLGISRTPLREALAQLVAEGALTALPRIGYFVSALTLEDFEQLYPLRAILDPAALRLAGLPSRRSLARLRLLNDRIGAESDPARVLERDDEWHRELLSHCPNRILLALVDQFIARTRRYELALMRERANVERAVVDHHAILEALDAGDLDAACAALEANMQSGKAPVVAWLKSREASTRPIKNKAEP